MVAYGFLNHFINKHSRVVNHINFDKTDNNVNNLELVSQRENSNMMHINNTSKFRGVFYDKKYK